MKKIIKFVVYICFVFLLIYNMTIVTQKIFNSDQIPSFFGYKNFVILSGSMENALKTGDVVFVKEKDEIKSGDIISYREKQAIITHRVMDVIKQDGKIYYKTKGDANDTIDKELVTIDEIEGVYCFKISKIGTIIVFLQSKTGMIVFLIILFLVYRHINKNSKRKTNRARH